MKTRFKNYKTFKNSHNAEKYIEKMKKMFPNEKFSIKKRTFYGKIKCRYTVRSV